MSDDITQPEDGEASAPANQKVTILVLGSSDREVAYTDGMTAAEALKRAEIELKDGQTLTLNGERVARPSKTRLQPSDRLQVASQVANG